MGNPPPPSINLAESVWRRPRRLRWIWFWLLLDIIFSSAVTWATGSPWWVWGATMLGGPVLVFLVMLPFVLVREWNEARTEVRRLMAVKEGANGFLERGLTLKEAGGAPLQTGEHTAEWAARCDQFEKDIQSWEKEVHGYLSKHLAHYLAAYFSTDGSPSAVAHEGNPRVSRLRLHLECRLDRLSEILKVQP